MYFSSWQSRYQGALVGMAVADGLALSAQLAAQPVQQPGASSPQGSAQQVASPWGHWCGQILTQNPYQQPPFLTGLRLALQPLAQSQPCGFAIALAPYWLVWADDAWLGQWQTCLTGWPQPLEAESIAASWLVSATLRHLLQAQAPRMHQLVSTLVNQAQHLERIEWDGMIDTTLGESIALIQACLGVGAQGSTVPRRDDLQGIVQANLPQKMQPIAIALYALSTTPTSYALALTQAGQATYQPHLTQTITGLLSGALVGMRGIPPLWQMPETAPSHLIKEYWQLPQETNLQHLSIKWLGHWAGVQTTALEQWHTPLTPAIYPINAQIRTPM